MTRFITKYAERIKGVLSGFDRLVFRGTLRRIAFPEGLGGYLHAEHVLLKEFGDFAHDASEAVKRASLIEADVTGAPVDYLPSGQVNKEEIGRRYAAEREVDTGLVCVLKCVEPCQSFEIYRNAEAHRLELVGRRRKCLHFYHYWMHPVFGFMNARIQTWFPFSVQVCLNGREWLAQQMEAAGMRYERADNCFADVEDFTRAQQLLDEQLKSDWPQLLDEIAHRLNPIHDKLFECYPTQYYWSTHQSEWATDVVFNDPEWLARLYPKLVSHAMGTMDSPDVLRFLGHRIPVTGKIPGSFQGEVTSDLKRRVEGARVKHTVKGNSIKVYDKLYTAEVAVLRAEATLNNASDFKVYRPKEGGPDDELDWRELRRGIADLHRRAEVSQRVNERYLDALASVDDSTTLGELLGRVTEPATWNGKRVRALQPFAAEDLRLCKAVSRGEFAISGIRNRDLQQLLFDDEPATPAERRRRSAWVGRRIRLLRAHGILQKVNKTHRYQIPPEGRRVLTALLTARETPIHSLLPEHLAQAA